MEIIKKLTNWWVAIAVSGLVAGLLSTQRVPAFLDIGLARPVFFLSLFLTLIALLTSLWFKDRQEEVYARLKKIFPWALIVGIGFSWLGWWNDGSGLSVMSPVDFGLFVVTLGVWPLKTGPDAFMRFTTIASVVLFVLVSWRQTPNAKRSLLMGLTMWGSSALLLGLPSLVAYLLAAFDATFVIRHAQDAWNLLVRAHLNSYWSTFQADRFFVGIGQQQGITMALATTVWFFLITVILVGWLWLKPYATDFKNELLQTDLVRWFLFMSPLVLGMMVGFRQQRWNMNWADIIALLLFTIVCFAWFLSWKNSGGGEKEMIVKGLSLIGAFLLGWPVFIGTLGLLVVSHMTWSEAWGWWKKLEGRAAVTFSLAILLVFLGTVFAARSFMLPVMFYRWSLGWGVIAIAIQLLHSLKIETTNIRMLLGVVIIGGLGFAVIVRLPIIAAITALLTVFLVWLQKRPAFWQRWAPLSLGVFFWLSVFLGLK